MVNPTRRKFVTGIAGVALGGGVVVATQTQQAKASELDVDNLSVENVSHESPDGMVEEVHADVTANYAIDATTTVSEVTVTQKEDVLDFSVGGTGELRVTE